MGARADGIPTAALTRAKLNTITLRSARSRRPTSVLVSIRSRSSRVLGRRQDRRRALRHDVLRAPGPTPPGSRAAPGGRRAEVALAAPSQEPPHGPPVRRPRPPVRDRGREVLQEPPHRLGPRVDDHRVPTRFVWKYTLRRWPETSRAHEAVEGTPGHAGDLGDGRLGDTQLEEAADLVLLAVEP